MAAAAQRLEVLDDAYAVCRLPPDAVPPADPGHASLFSVTRTPDELSIVGRFDDTPEGARIEGPFAAVRVSGTLDFALTGVLAGLTAPLAEADVSVFAVSTFDTDYLLLPREQLADALDALAAAGHEVVGSPP